MTTDSISRWLDELKDGEPEAAQHIWQRYYTRLIRLARDRLGAVSKRVADEEDVVLSAFNSLCTGAAEGRFPQLDDDDDLWRLLVVITERKAWKLIERERRQKRGGGKVRGDSIFDGDKKRGGFAEFAADEPTPDFAAVFVDEVKSLFHSLEDPVAVKVVLLRMEGYSIGEIAAELAVSTRTIKRKLQLVRQSLSVESST